MRSGLVLLATVAGVSLAACAPGDAQEAVAQQSDRPMAPPALMKDGATMKSVVDLTVAQVVESRANRDVRLIDVRRDDEVAQGMIPGAEHIPLSDFDPASVMQGDDRPIIIYCRSGRRSGIAGAALAEHLGKPVAHLAGGITAWQDAGQPITR